jgi:hypothetical protein
MYSFKTFKMETCADLAARAPFSTSESLSEMFLPVTWRLFRTLVPEKKLFFFKEVARGWGWVERTRVLSITFIFSFSPIYC